jgi:hypothetical protein
MGAKRGNIIRWSGDEWRKTVEYGVNQYLKTGAIPKLDEAQRNVRGVRVRSNLHFAVTRDYKNRVREALLELEKQGVPIAPEAANETTAAAPTESFTIVDINDDDTPAPRSIRDQIVPEIIGLGAEIIVGILTHESVRTALREASAALLGRQVESAAAKELKFETTTPGRKILIAGLLPSQANVIRKEFADKFNLQFWGADESPHRLRLLAKEADVTVGYVSFLSHSHDDIMKGNAKQFVRHGGGMTGLKARLRGLMT